MNSVIQGRPMVAGDAFGSIVATDEPLSFWGGVDPVTGRVIDRRHPLAGTFLGGKILVLPFGRGSCSASGVLLEAIQNQVAPIGIVVSRIDPIIGLGAILGHELVGIEMPVVLVTDEERAILKNGLRVQMFRSGRLEVLEVPTAKRTVTIVSS